MLVLVEVFTRYVWLRLLRSQTQHVVCLVIEAIFTEYGVPFELVTEPTSIFKGHEFRQLLQTFGVDHHLSTPPSHAGNGVVERCIGLTRTALAIQNLQNNCNWSQNLSAAQQCSISIRNNGHDIISTLLPPNVLLPFATSTRGHVHSH